MEIETYYSDEKLSHEGGWEETKESLDSSPPASREEIVSSLEKLYGPSKSCELDENNQYFTMILEEERCTLSDDMLQSFLPKSSYEALSNMSNDHRQDGFKTDEGMKQVEELIRLAFQNGEQVPPECQSFLWEYQKQQDPFKRYCMRKRTRK